MATITYQDLPETRPINQIGWYRGKVVKAVEEMPNGDSKFILSLVTPEGESITERILVRDTTQWKVEKWLKAAGYQFKKGQQVELTPDTFLGNEIDFEVGLEASRNDPEKKFFNVVNYAPKGTRTGAAKAVQKPVAAKLPQATDDDLPY